jgi:aspartyl-tRNA(Asn)/glutamyl-tRNA(Gln) amidotransferase subunit A
LFSFQSITQYHTALQNGNTTCVTAVEFYLQQIEKQSNLNAFVQVFTADALAKAAALDAQRLQHPTKPLGKLHGVVVSIKDVICYKGHTITAASAMLHNYTSLYNATAVQRLLDQDAIIIGINNCDEFAMGSGSENSIYGVIKNAANTSKVPGGSSGGSAVAVQAHMCMVSLGSDTGGSVRQPADFCGIVGYKPTYGGISRHGLIAYASSFDQIGILAHSITDVSAVLAVISGPDEYDTTALQQKIEPLPATSNNKTYKIAYFNQALHNTALDSEIATATFQKIEELKSKGHSVEAIDFPLMDYLVPTYYVLTTAEASSNLNRYDGVKFGHRTNKPYHSLNHFYELNRTEGFGKEVQKRIMLGTFVLSSGYYDAYYTKAQQVRQLLAQFIQTVFTTYDFIIIPTVPKTAPNIGDKEKDPIAVYLSDVYTVLSNLTGIPAVAIPVATHSNGMPFGMQLMAAASNDALLLQFAEQV